MPRQLRFHETSGSNEVVSQVSGRHFADQHHKSDLEAPHRVQLERHGDLFAATGSDEEWLRYCGDQDRVALTHSSRIRYVPNDRLMFAHANETARCYEGKVVRSVGDANIGSIMGWGFAPFQGGTLRGRPCRQIPARTDNPSAHRAPPSLEHDRPHRRHPEPTRLRAG